MSNDFEKKTEELIELANDGIEESVEKVEEAKSEAIEEIKEAQEEAIEKIEEVKKAAPAVTVPDAPAKKKKKGVFGKIILAVVGVVLALVIALVGTGCGMLSCATTDEMPEAAPAATEDEMTEFVLGAVTEIIKDNTISVTPEVINGLLVSVKESVNNSIDMIRIDDLFCELEGTEGTFYARVYIGKVNVKGIEINVDKTVPVQAGFTVDFNNDTKDIIIDIGEIYCGKIQIPEQIINTALTQIELPEGMSVDAAGNVLYNTSGLDAMIDEAVSDAITSSMEGVLGGWLSDFATNLTDVELTDAEIKDGAIVIHGKVF